MKLLVTFIAVILGLSALADDQLFNPIRINYWTTTTEGAVSNTVISLAQAAAVAGSNNVQNTLVGGVVQGVVTNQLFSNQGTNTINVLIGNATNTLVAENNGVATNLAVYNNVTLGQFPWITFNTNAAIGINGAGVVAANGTYIPISSVIWTNIRGNGSSVNFINPTWFLQTNQVNLYSTSNLVFNSVWLNVIGSTAVPTNSGFGYVNNHNGILDSNVWASSLAGIVPMANIDTTKVLTNGETAATLLNGGLTLGNSMPITATGGAYIGGVLLGVATTNGDVLAASVHGGNFFGNGAGLTNVSLIGVTSPNFNISAFSTLSYTTTNPVDIVNAYQVPRVVGHYVFSTVFGAYTNQYGTNYLLDNNASIGAWVITTNINDVTGDNSLYSYVGSYPFPTNDPANWLLGNFADSVVPASLDIGTLVNSNNPVVSLSPSGQNIVALDASTGISVQYSGMVLGGPKLLYQFQNEQSPAAYEGRENFYGGPGYAYTNDYNSGHSFAVGIQIQRLNYECTNINAGDNRGVLQVGSIFGKRVLNGDLSMDLSHVADNGGSWENLVRRNLTNSTAGQSGTFMHPMRVNGDSTVMLGDIPEALHGLYYWTPAMVDIWSGYASKVGLLIRGQPTYTGAVTNGGFWSDSTRVYAQQQGVQFPIPQVQNTNVNFSGGTSFTWHFQYPFADTNYSVATMGAAATLASPLIGAKTATDVTVSFTAFTGNLNLIAAHQ